MGHTTNEYTNINAFPFRELGRPKSAETNLHHPPFQYCTGSSLRTDSPDVDCRCVGTLPHFGRPGVVVFLWTMITPTRISTRDSSTPTHADASLRSPRLPTNGYDHVLHPL